MGKYGIVGVRAVQLVNSEDMDPRTAWQRATSEVFPLSTSCQEKGCPRDAFLALCGEGRVKGVPRGTYSRSKKNRHYALAAVERLETNPGLKGDAAVLWLAVLNGQEKRHNGQMEVVLALWDAGLLNRSC